MSANPAAVPLCDLNIQYRELQQEIEAAVSRVLASGQVINGPEVAAFEREAAAYLGAKHAVGCSSGTDAISLALHALDIGPGDEVILPPFTFFATVGCICRAGATSVFADIDAVSFNIDPIEVEKKVTPRTKAIMPVHLYGQCAEMAPLRQIAAAHGLALIEDAAQAFGADYHGKRAGALGSIGCFSFYPSKNLGTYGDAGLVTTDNSEWAAKMMALRNHGMEPKYFHKYVGWNARIDAIHAAILRVKLPHVDRWTTARQAAALRYDGLIASHGMTQLMHRPELLPDRRHVFNQYVVRVPAAMRDGLVQYLKNNGVGCEIYYPLPLHLQECLASLGHKCGDFPASEEAARSVIALPLFPEITGEQQARVIEVCAAVLRPAVRAAA